MAEDKKINFSIKFRPGAVILIIMLIAAAFGGYKLNSLFYKNKQPEITAAYISEKIESASELTTSELVYNGLVIYSEGDIPLLTRKGFSMRYSANIRAGINFSDIKTDITKDKVNIKIPHAEVQSIDVDTGSIQFYDEKYALFNWTQKEDVIDAISISKEDASSHANTAELVKRADAQTEIILKSILAGSIGDRKLNISFQ